jgi:hypothetical protein
MLTAQNPYLVFDLLAIITGLARLPLMDSMERFLVCNVSYEKNDFCSTALVRESITCEISGSHGCEYEDDSFPGYCDL